MQEYPSYDFAIPDLKLNFNVYRMIFPSSFKILVPVYSLIEISSISRSTLKWLK